jgi:hypothetical protein
LERTRTDFLWQGDKTRFFFIFLDRSIGRFQILEMKFQFAKCKKENKFQDLVLGQTKDRHLLCRQNNMLSDKWWIYIPFHYLSLSSELSKSLSCLSDNRSGRCGQCVRPNKHLPDLHFFYNFNWITHILAKSIKWFVYSFKWYLGILKVSTTHLCVTCGNIHTIQ